MEPEPQPRMDGWNSRKGQCLFRVREMARFSLLIAVLFLVSSICSCGRIGTERSNVIVIVIDALRADHLSCYGHATKTTPNIDKLAGTSLLYENAYSVATWTVPSSASLFTSTLPVVHRINHAPKKKSAFSVLSEEFVLPNEVFKEHGYATGMITTIGWVSPTANYHQGTDEHVRSKTGDAALVREAMEFIDRHRSKTFHLYLHFIDLHDYHNPAKLFDEELGQPIDASSNLMALKGLNTEQSYKKLIKELSEPGMLTPRDLDVLRASYDRELRLADGLIGALVEHLENRELLDKTLIVVTSDHGEQFLEHQKLMYASDGFYNEVLRIPFIIAGPGRFEGQTRIITPVSSIDFYPILFHLVGIEPPSLFQGEKVIDDPGPDRAVYATDGRI